MIMKTHSTSVWSGLSVVVDSLTMRILMHLFIIGARWVDLVNESTQVTSLHKRQDTSGLLLRQG